jgi:hypothetical protein
MATRRKNISLNDTEYFCNVSWTLSFNMNTKSWISFHSYIPNFYIAENNFFYSGVNSCCEEFDFLVGTLVPNPSTTTTTTSSTSSTTTTTTTEVPLDCEFNAEIVETDCELEGIGQITDADCDLIGEGFVINADCELEGIGEIIITPTTTTTTTTAESTTTTTTTSSSTTTTTTTTICNRPENLSLQGALIFRWSTPTLGSNWILSLSVSQACDSFNLISQTSTSTEDGETTLWGFDADSMAIGQTLWRNCNDTSCLTIPNGTYFYSSDYGCSVNIVELRDLTTIDIVVVSGGQVVSIDQCNYVGPTTTTTTTTTQPPTTTTTTTSTSSSTTTTTTTSSEPTTTTTTTTSTPTTTTTTTTSTPTTTTTSTSTSTSTTTSTTTVAYSGTCESYSISDEGDTNPTTYSYYEYPSGTFITDTVSFGQTKFFSAYSIPGVTIISGDAFPVLIGSCEPSTTTTTTSSTSTTSTTTSTSSTSTTTSTSTTIAPSNYSCNDGIIQLSTSDLNQGSYTSTIVSSLSDECFTFNWFVVDRPNRFSVYDSTGLIWTSGWVGSASYSGPWGASLSTPGSGISSVLTFLSTSGRYVSVEYGPADLSNPLTDVAEWSLSCSVCTTTTTTTI